jgi:hypothetical protein
MTTDNDFLWTAANVFYAPATPFGIWSATPSGCALSVSGTGICSAPIGTNGYANLGGSSDYTTISVSGNSLQTTLGVGPVLTFQNDSSGYWVLPQTVLNLGAGVGDFPLIGVATGWLNFGGQAPSPTTFENGLQILAFFIHAPQHAAAQVLATYPDAQYVGESWGWVVNFQVIVQQGGCHPSSCPIPSGFFGIPGGQFTTSDLFGNLLTLDVGGTTITPSTVTVGGTAYAVYTTNGAPVPFPIRSPLERGGGDGHGLLEMGAPAGFDHGHGHGPSTSFALMTTDNDFLWTAANVFYAPATPFGIWSATPSGCALSVSGTGICSAPIGTNGYANLGGSSDYTTISVSGNSLQTTLGVGPVLTFQNDSSGYWVLPQTVLNLGAGVGDFPLIGVATGWLNFGGQAPSPTTFENGLQILAFFIHAPQHAAAQVLATYPDAQYVGESWGWVVNFQVIVQEGGCHPSSCPIPSGFFGIPGGQFTTSDLFGSLLTLDVGGTSITPSTVTVGGIAYTVYTTNGAPVAFPTPLQSGGDH